MEPDMKYNRKTERTLNSIASSLRWGTWYVALLAVLFGCCAVNLHTIQQDVQRVRESVYGKTIDERLRSIRSQIEYVE
jgi:hypothetical protein